MTHYKTTFAALTAAIAMTSAMPSDDRVMTTSGATTEINTTTLASDVEGYNGPTPLRITIHGGVVKEIKALPNSETRSYFARATRGLLDKWNGKTVRQALKLKVDAVSGATYSSDAIIENVRRGLQYYTKHRK